MSVQLKAVPARLFANGIDTVTPLTQQNCKDLKAEGMDFVVRYLHNITQEEIEWIVGAGLAFMLVTYAGNFNGMDALETANRLGYPTMATLWLDVESVSVDVATVIGDINDWGRVVKNIYDPGVYAGCQALLTSAEWTGLIVDRYWESCSDVRDRNQNAARPFVGWCMQQLFPPNQWVCGVKVDRNVIRADFKMRVPTWAVAA